MKIAFTLREKHMEVYYEYKPDKGSLIAPIRAVHVDGKWLLRHQYPRQVECSQEQSWDLYEARKNEDVLVFVDTPVLWLDLG